MYEISAAALRSLGSTHAVSARLLASVNRSLFTYPVKLVDGVVAVDSSNPIRRKLTAEILANVSDPECDVFKTELRAEYGISLNNFSWIWIPVGTFVVVDAEQIEDGVVQIKGEDRWRRVEDARFLRPVSTSGLHITAIRNFMIGADSRIDHNDFSGVTSAHRTSLWERDRAKAVLELSKSSGTVTYFNPLGVAETRNIPVVKNVPDWSLGGGDGGVLVSAWPSASRDGTYNAMVVEGEDSSGNVAVRAVATVYKSDSKLFFGGAAGQKPRYYRSPLITTQAQAVRVADAMIIKFSSVAKKIKIEAFVNPALEAGDTVSVEVTPGKWELHVVEAFDIPLGPGGTSIKTRTTIDDEDGSE